MSSFTIPDTNSKSTWKWMESEDDCFVSFWSGLFSGFLGSGLFWQGSLNGTHFGGGSNLMQIYGDFEGIPPYNDPIWPLFDLLHHFSVGFAKLRGSWWMEKLYRRDHQKARRNGGQQQGSFDFWWSFFCCVDPQMQGICLLEYAFGKTLLTKRRYSRSLVEV